MIVKLRHTSDTQLAAVEAEALPDVGDKLEHPRRGSCVVSHVYPAVGLVVVVSPGKAVW